MNFRAHSMQYIMTILIYMVLLKDEVNCYSFQYKNFQKLKHFEQKFFHNTLYMNRM